MKKLFSYSNFNKIAALGIALCLIVALYTGYQRMSVKKNYTNIEISLDF